MTTKFSLKNYKSNIGNKISRRILFVSVPILALFILSAVIFSYRRLNTFQETTNNKNLYLRHQFTVDYLSQWASEGHMILKDFAQSENLQNQYDTPIKEEDYSYISSKLLSITDSYEMTDKIYFDQAIVVNKDGQILASSDENLLFTSIIREYFFVNYARQGLDGVYFIEDLTSMFPQQSIVQIYPLFTNLGNPNGAVIGISSVSHLSNSVNSTQRIFPESDLFIVSEDQNYYLYSPDNKTFSIQNINDSQKQIYESLFSKNSEKAGIVYSENTNFDNQISQTVFNWENNLNLGIGTSYTPEELTQQYYLYVGIYIFSTVLVLALFIYLINFFVNNSLAPISQIINANEHLSIGDWNFQLPSLKNKDFAELTSSYIKLLDRLMRMGFLPNTVNLDELSDDPEDLQILEEIITTSEEDLLSELDTIEKSVQEFTEKTSNYETEIKTLKNELLIYKNIIAEINYDLIFSKINEIVSNNFGVEKFEFYLKYENETELINASENKNQVNIFNTNLENISWSVENKIARNREIEIDSTKSYFEFIAPIVSQEISYGAFVFYSSKNIFKNELINILIDLGQNIGKIIRFSNIFNQLKNSIIDEVNSNTHQIKNKINLNNNSVLDEENIKEEYRIKYVDLNNDQQVLLEKMLSEIQSINNFDILLKTFIKKISDLPHVSETIIQSFIGEDIDK